MQLVEIYLAQKQAQLVQHPFFLDLERNPTFPDALTFAPDLTFWVMAFQDILRLNTRRTREKEILRMVKHHRAEDAGHERWFLSDLAVLKMPTPDVKLLFGKEHAPTRDAAYALISEVFRTNDDRLRLILVKALESAGHIFFEKVSRIVENANATNLLKYFSFNHLEVEKNHEVFEREMAEKISSIQLSPSARAEAEELIDRCYAAFTSMFDALRMPEHRRDDSAAAIPARDRAAVRAVGSRR
jgi:hypothetical protein